MDLNLIAKLFALYWEQKVFTCPHWKGVYGTDLYFSADCWQEFKKLEGDNAFNTDGAHLLLKHLSALTVEDAIELCKIKSPLSFASPNPRKWKVENVKDHYLKVSDERRSVHSFTIDLVDGEVLLYVGDELEITAGGITIDYLRSTGYAVPYMDLSVDELIGYGFIKIKEGE